MSPLSKSILQSPAWLTAMGITTLMLVSPKPQSLWLLLLGYVIQATGGIFLIAFPFYKRTQLKYATIRK
jgi:DMSO reductase anchor subunit